MPNVLGGTNPSCSFSDGWGNEWESLVVREERLLGNGWGFTEFLPFLQPLHPLIRVRIAVRAVTIPITIADMSPPLRVFGFCWRIGVMLKSTIENVGIGAMQKANGRTCRLVEIVMIESVGFSAGN